MDENEFYGDGKQRPANEGGRFRAEYYDRRLKSENTKGCGCALVVLVAIAALIAGVVWLVTGTK